MDRMLIIVRVMLVSWNRFGHKFQFTDEQLAAPEDLDARY